MRRNLARNLVTVGTALLALALSACGGASTTGPTGGAAVTAPTATATATAAATATAQPTSNTTGMPAGCSDMATASTTRIGDLVFSKETKALDYPDWTIPPGTPTQPFRITQSATGSPAPGSVEVGSGATDGYFTFMVCNASTTRAHMLQSVSVRVASFTPYSGPLLAWSPCGDGSFDAQTRTARSGGCGGGFAANEYLQANFSASAGVGAIVTAQVSSTSPAGPGDPNPYPSLPLSLAPGHMVSMGATLTVPTTPGSYAFAFGLAVDSTSAAYFSTSSSELYAPITQHWTGQNCTTTAMQSQIPAASQPTQYVCPPAS